MTNPRVQPSLRGGGGGGGVSAGSFPEQRLVIEPRDYEAEITF